jgi:polysaccharide chain length determinant protein (PEP-CTERM system associated)
MERSGDGKDTGTRMAEISAQLEAARLQLREAERSRDVAKRQLAEARGQAPSGTALPNLLAGRSESGQLATIATPEIDSRIDAQKRTLDGLLQRYTDQHPDVVNTRRLIADLEEQRRKEVIEGQKRAAAMPVGAATPNDNLAVQELSRTLSSAEVQIAAIQARVEEYASRYAQVRESLKTAPQIEAEMAQLNRDYSITKANYESLVARRQSAVMSGELDVASGMAEFRLIDPPRAGTKPVSPNRPLLLPLVLVAALGLGLLVAFGASQLRPTFGDADELRLRTGLPLLGVVTLLTTDRDRRRDRAGLLRFIAASGGLVGLFVAGLITMTLMSRLGA